MNETQLYNLATDISNIPPMPIRERLRFRRLIFDAMALAVEAAQRDPKIHQTIKNWSEVDS